MQYITYTSGEGYASHTGHLEQHNVMNDSLALVIYKPSNVGPPYTDVVRVVL